MIGIDLDESLYPEGVKSSPSALSAGLVPGLYTSYAPITSRLSTWRSTLLSMSFDYF